jgi:hypothetical protein
LTEDYEIIELVDGENQIKNQRGTFRMRMVANDAKGSISYTIS